MDPAIFENAFILTGPTATGKSQVGLALAERLGAEIVAMDSMTLYRGMDIGTAKPTLEVRQRVPHRLIDVLEPWESSSLAWWLHAAAAAVHDIESRGKRVLFVGGTPLYLKGLLRGIFAGPAGDPEVRSRLESPAGADLHARLAAVDPISAQRLHANDARRLVRALEVFELTGKPISEWQQEFKRVRPRSGPVVWLDVPRPVLYARVDERVRRMIAEGLLDEVRRLRALPRPLSKEARQAIGYRELMDALDGLESVADAVVRIQTRTRNYAKHQTTWFRHLAECRRVEVGENEAVKAIVERVAMMEL